MTKKNISILEHMKTYCEDIMRSVERFGNEKAVFDADRVLPQFRMHEPTSNWRTDRTSDGRFSGRNKKEDLLACN